MPYIASGYDQWVAAAGDDDDDTIRSITTQTEQKESEGTSARIKCPSGAPRVCDRESQRMHAPAVFFLLVCGFVKGTTRREIGSTYGLFGWIFCLEKKSPLWLLRLRPVSDGMYFQSAKEGCNMHYRVLLLQSQKKRYSYYHISLSSP